MKTIEWVKTLEGAPLGFPDVGAIRAGERARLGDEDAARAVASGLAVEVGADDKRVIGDMDQRRPRQRVGGGAPEKE